MSSLPTFPFFSGLLSSQLFTAYCAFSFLFLRPFLPFSCLTPALSFSLRITPFPSLFFLAFSAFSFLFPGLLLLLAFYCVLRLFLPFFLAVRAFCFPFPLLLQLLTFNCILRLFLYLSWLFVSFPSFSWLTPALSFSLVLLLFLPIFLAFCAFSYLFPGFLQL